MTNSIRQLLCTLALAALAAVPALADSVAYTNLGPGDSYSVIAAFSVAGVDNSFGSLGYSWADQFTASVGGNLSQIDVGLANISGTNSAVISIYTDVSNNLGSLLFSGMVSNQPAFGSTTTTLAMLSPNSGILVAGESYFLVVAPGAADTEDAWNFNGTGALGTVLLNQGSGFVPLLGSPTSNGAFDVRVNATAAPEPSTWLMLGAELLCLLGASIRLAHTRCREVVSTWSSCSLGAGPPGLSESTIVFSTT
jgi:hypothetical protein